MTRICRRPGCTREAETQRRQCRPCRQRTYRERHPRTSTWADADPVDVELVIESPRPVGGLTRLERVLVARGLNAREMTAEQIAAVVGVSPRTVYRWRTSEPASTRAAA